jgi:hypothetical protein
VRNSPQTANLNRVEEFCLLEYKAMYSSESQPTVPRNISPQSSRSKNMPNWHEEGMKQGSSCYSFMLESFLAYSSTLKMKAIYSSEISVDFRRVTWSHISENRTLHKYRCENLRYYLMQHSVFPNFELQSTDQGDPGRNDSCVNTTSAMEPTPDSTL